MSYFYRQKAALFVHKDTTFCLRVLKDTNYQTV